MQRISQAITAILFITLLAALWGGPSMAVTACLLCLAALCSFALIRKVCSGRSLTVTSYIALLALIVAVFSLPQFQTIPTQPLAETSTADAVELPSSPAIIATQIPTAAPFSPSPITPADVQSSAVIQSATATQSYPVAQGGAVAQNSSVEGGAATQNGPVAQGGAVTQNGPVAQGGAVTQNVSVEGGTVTQNGPVIHGPNISIESPSSDGRDGRDGQDGRDGRDGRDGAPGLVITVIVLSTVTTPLPTPTATPTATPTEVPTVTQTSAPTATPTATPIEVPTVTQTSMPTGMSTELPTATLTATATSTSTEIPTATLTATPTEVPTITQTSTPTELPTATPTELPSVTQTSTPTATLTATPAELPTATPTATLAPTCLPEERKALDILLVIDRSSSMNGQNIEDARQAAKTFVEYTDLAGDNQIGVATFASGSALAQSLTRNQNDIMAAIDSITTEKGTNIGAGITLAYEELIGARHSPTATQTMIVLSDGRPTVGGSPLHAAAIAKTAGVHIITIGLGENAAHALLRDIASSPDAYHFAPSASALEAIYIAIAGKFTHTCE